MVIICKMNVLKMKFFNYFIKNFMIKNLQVQIIGNSMEYMIMRKLLIQFKAIQLLVVLEYLDKVQMLKNNFIYHFIKD